MRLFNTQVNPFVRMLPQNRRQSAIFVRDDGMQGAPGLEGGVPQWIYAEFTLASQDAQDARIKLPDDFTLLCFLASSTLAAGFLVQAYDVNRKLRLIERPILFSNFAGQGKSPSWLRNPYSFVSKQAECLIRASNLALAQNVVEVVLFGVIGGK